MKKLLTVICISVLLTAGAVSAQNVAPFKKGDRVAFIGNSITDGGRYHSFIWLYYMTHFPDQRLDIFNCGIGGDTAADMFKRLDGDVFSKNPNVITLTFGMNDSGYYEYNGDNAKEFADKRVAMSEESFRKIEDRLKGLQNTDIIMIGGSPYDETAKIKNDVFRKKNAAMDRIVAIQKQTAIDNKWGFVDFSAPMTALNTKFQKTDSTFTLCGGDRVHPDNDGHMVMAYLFLKSQGFAGKCVADFVVDAKKSGVSKSENCVVDNVKVTSRKISFDYLAASLPYPLDTITRGWGAKKNQAGVTKVVPFMEEMNREVVAVKGLKSAEYELSIDNQKIGVFTSKELEQGVNLAEYCWTPQYQQALKVMVLNEERWEIERRFRDYAWVQFGFFQQHGKLFANDRDAVALFNRESVNNGWLRAKQELYNRAIHSETRDAWNREMELLVSTIYDINRPVKRTFVLEAVK